MVITMKTSVLSVLEFQRLNSEKLSKLFAVSLRTQKPVNALRLRSEVFGISSGQDGFRLFVFIGTDKFCSSA